MKKIIIFIMLIVIIVVSIFSTKYISYKINLDKIKENNLEFEYYLNKQVNGNDIVTLINKAVNSNEKNKVAKNEKGLYIQNNINSIKIQVTTIDLGEEITYDMESFYNNGMAKFNTLYSSIMFECTKIEYNSLGKVNYMLFVQRTT